MNLEWTMATIRSIAELGVTALLHVSWMSLAVCAVFGWMHRQLRSNSAQTRYALLASALLVLVALPPVTAAVLMIMEQGSTDKVVAARVAESDLSANVVDANAKQTAASPAHFDDPSHSDDPLHSDDPGHLDNPALEDSISSNTGVPPVGERLSPSSSLVPRDEDLSLWGIARRDGSMWLFGAYALIALVLQTRLLHALLGGQRLCRRASRVTNPAIHNRLESIASTLQLRAIPQLAYSADVAVPTVIGLWRATVLLPAAYASNLTLRELETILFHELAHIRRHDFALNVLQRVVEGVYFFHPAVWWLSRQLRIEREYCCDDLAVAKGSQVDMYVKVLLRVAELSKSRAGMPAEVIGVHAIASPSSLRQRVARLLGEPACRQRLRVSAAWPWALLVTAVLLLGLLVPGNRTHAESTERKQDDWGTVSGGLQMRVVSVGAKSDEQSPELAEAERTNEFDSVEEVTLLVELKNTSDKPIQLQGVRYGNAVSEPWVGKSNSDTFAPFLFSCRILDDSDESIQYPRGIMDSNMWMLSVHSGRAENLEPNESTLMLLRPFRWDATMADQLVAGEYELELAYHGTPEPIQEQIAARWPDSDLASIWWGSVTGPRVTFTIRSGAESMPELAWGDPEGGIRVAAEYRLADRRTEDLKEYSKREFPINAKLDVTFHFQNVSDEPIDFESDRWIQECSSFLVNPDGSESRLSQAWYSGITPLKTWRIAPQQIVSIPSMPMAIKSSESDATFAHPIGPVVEHQPGKVMLRHEIGKRETGVTTLNIREREDRDDPPRFEATLQFEATDGSEVLGGFVEVQPQTGGAALYSGEIDANVLKVETTDEALRITVRLHGLEEETFYDVRPLREGVTRLSLAPSKPIRFRVTDQEGQAVSGALIRRFNRSKENSASDPLPVDGTEGPVFAVSQDNGHVSIDSVSEGRGGEANGRKYVYWFLIDHPDFAHRFIGPITAGTDLETIVLSSPIEVSGTILGTDDELPDFRAEFDQPLEMRPETDEHQWSYAVTKRLSIDREGKDVTFQLRGLRPGKLRIIGNYSKNSQGSHYESGKRVPKGDDLVWEFELSESRNDLILSRSTALDRE